MAYNLTVRSGIKINCRPTLLRAHFSPPPHSKFYLNPSTVGDEVYGQKGMTCRLAVCRLCHACVTRTVELSACRGTVEGCVSAGLPHDDHTSLGGCALSFGRGRCLH
jgi:hypothetical protein